MYVGRIARLAQYDAVCDWGVPFHARLQRVTAIEAPTFIANGDADPMILPRYSYLLAGLIPQAGIKIYSDAGHGFLFQHPAEFAEDVEASLTKTPCLSRASEFHGRDRAVTGRTLDQQATDPHGGHHEHHPGQ